MKKISILAIALLIIPCAIFLTACSGLNPFASSNGGENNKDDDNHTCIQTPCDLPHLSGHTCPPCNKSHLDSHTCPPSVSSSMIKENLNILGEISYDADMGGGSTYHYFTLKDNLVTALKSGNILVVEFTASFPSGATRTYKSISEITSNGTANASYIVYVNNNEVVTSTSGGGMLGSVLFTLKGGSGTSGAYMRYSASLYPQSFNGMIVTITGITVYGNVA